MKNQVQLITYVDRLSGGSINTLEKLLSDQLDGLFGGTHLLPFFDPIDGSDAGFDPIDHTSVDPRLGNWDDVKSLGSKLELVADLIANHVSINSPQCQDWIEKGNKSEYAGLFMTMDKVFPNGATQEELLAIYRPRPGLPFNVLSLKDGSKSIVWNTFTPQQMDIDVFHPKGQEYLRSILDRYSEVGVKMIRLDAAGYAVKKPGTSCFMLPETFQFIGDLRDYAQSLGIEVLVEIHSYYKTQVEIAKKVDWVYDFALPPLVLQGLFKGTAKNLKQWLAISPRNAITVLDTHDGIGVIDVGADSINPGSKGLLTPSEINELVETMHERSQGESRHATGAAASNLDLYQVNCTFYDALGANDNEYLLARLIQFCAPGIPQIYYTGLLAGRNDMALLAKSNVGRDINRHYYDEAEINEAIQQPVVQDLFKLIKFRNSHPAFNGDFTLLDSPESELAIEWLNGQDRIELSIDLASKSFTIASTINGSTDHISTWAQLG